MAAPTQIQPSGPDQQPANVEITIDLVEKVADRVYELWRQDLRLERERRRIATPTWRRR